MIIACIVCGGVVETTLILMGLSALLNWAKRRHKKDKCNCCKEHAETKKDPLSNSRPMTPDERSSINKFAWSHFDKKDKNERT